MRRNNFLSFILSVFVAIIAGYQLDTFILLSPNKLAMHGLLKDDAYFYSVLARNFHQHGFLTLDGHMPTNGVQPLWMIVQIVLTGIFPKINSALLLSISSWVCYLLFSFFTIRLVSRTASFKSTVLSTMVVSGLIILNVRFQNLVVTGLEVPLMLLLLVLLFQMIDDFVDERIFEGKDSKVSLRVMTLGIVTTLVFFVRTDLFWVTAITGFWLSVIGKPSLRNFVIYYSVVITLVLPYLLFNLVTQNSIMPISGRLKLFYLDLFYPNLVSYLHSKEWFGLFSAFTFHLPIPTKLAIIFTITILTFGFLIIWKYRTSNIFPTSLKLFSITIVGHLFYMYFLYRELRTYTSYYFAPEILWLALVITHYVAHLFEANRGNKWLLNLSGKYVSIAIVFVCMVIMVAFWIEDHKGPSSYWTERINLAYDIKNKVPEGESVGAFWPGAFAQFSGRAIIPLDGIIGSSDYFQRYVKVGHEINFLTDNSIEYLAIYLTRYPDDVFFQTKPKISDWSNLGTLRLWERHDLHWQVVAFRPLNTQGTGWYLLRLNK